ncbi:hypothetical protein Tco_1377784 [Tanacetum coccineum]
MLNHSMAEPMGILRDVMCQVGVTTIIAKFLILDMPIDRDTPIQVGRGITIKEVFKGFLLNKVTEALSKFAQAIESASKKTGDTRVSSAGQAESYPAEEEKNTQQVTISYPLKRSSQPERELIKKDKGKEAMSSKDLEEEKTKSDSNDDTINLNGSMVESSKKKKLKKFDFVTEQGDHVHFTKEQIKEQKRIEESVKPDIAKQEMEVRKEEWIDLFGVDVVTKYYKAKLQYDKYYDKMLRRAQSRITNYDVLTRKGPITLKVYREDGTDDVIPKFKASDLHLSEWREVVKACPNRKGAGWSTIYEQIQTRMDYLHKTEAGLGIDLDKPLGEHDPLDRLNDLARKILKHADDIHDLFRSTNKFKSAVQYGDHPTRAMLNEPVLGLILFNSFHRQDFVTIKDFEHFPN